MKLDCGGLFSLLLEMEVLVLVLAFGYSHTRFRQVDFYLFSYATLRYITGYHRITVYHFNNLYIS